MKKLSVIVAPIILLVGCNAQYVDVAQPVTAADKFYGALKSGNEKAALAQFAPEFKSHVDNWPWFLDGLQQKYGLVTSAELQRSSMAANDEGPCYLLNYAVKRASLATSETLFLCSKGGNSPWLIRGHAFTRLDNQKSVTAGVIPNEVGVHVP